MSMAHAFTALAIAVVGALIVWSLYVRRPERPSVPPLSTCWRCGMPSDGLCDCASSVRRCIRCGVFALDARGRCWGCDGPGAA